MLNTNYSSGAHRWVVVGGDRLVVDPGLCGGLKSGAIYIMEPITPLGVGMFLTADITYHIHDRDDKSGAGTSRKATGCERGGGLLVESGPGPD